MYRMHTVIGLTGRHEIPTQEQLASQITQSIRQRLRIAGHQETDVSSASFYETLQSARTQILEQKLQEYSAAETEAGTEEGSDAATSVPTPDSNLYERYLMQQAMLLPYRSHLYGYGYSSVFGSLLNGYGYSSTFDSLLNGF